jgi:endoglucanase
VTNTPTRTPTGFISPCSPATAISVPFPFDGPGTFCWQISSLSFINSWNLASLTVNGVDFTNKYAAGGDLPAKINGFWYISYTGNFGWSHFEAK